jgi:CheY-like chemotaxis protein
MAARPPLTGTILVVEDEDGLRLAVSKILQKHGLHVLAAETGEDALDLFRAHAKAIDLILLDLKLPGISGAELFVEVRRINPDVKVIVTTAYDPQSYGAGYPWAGQVPSSFIRKPYRLDEIVRAIREALAPDGSANEAILARPESPASAHLARSRST